MKRREIIKRINQIAKSKGLTLEVVEGKGHTKIIHGNAWTLVARHNEINEHTARSIIRWAEELKGE